MDTMTRRDLIEATRKACPDLSAVDGLRAVRTLAYLRQHPEETAARAAALATESDGTAPGTNGPAPDAFKARQHEVKTERTTKGVQTVTRVKVGMAYVQGRIDASAENVPGCEQDSDDAIRARTVSSVLLRGVKRNTVGALALDVQRVTDIAYGHIIEDVVAPLLGTDVTAYEQPATRADSTDSVSAAAGTAWISGPYVDRNVDSFAAPTAVYRANTRRTVHTVKHSPRLTLRKGRDRSGDVGPTCRAGILCTVSARYAPPVLVTPLVWSLVAPAQPTIRRRNISVPVTRAHRVIVERASLRTLPYRRWAMRHDCLTYAPTSNSSRETLERIGAPVAERLALVDHRWHGHQLVTRPDVKRNARKTDVKREQPTDIGTVVAPESAAGWEEILNGINRGESVKVRDADRVVVTITRNAQRFNANDRRVGREHTYKLRNVERLANALA